MGLSVLKLGFLITNINIFVQISLSLGFSLHDMDQSPLSIQKISLDTCITVNLHSHVNEIIYGY